jgi:hypothetical protein
VLPLHAGLFISRCFSKKTPLSGLSIEIVHSFDLLMTHTKPQLQTLRNHRVAVSQSQGQQNKGKMSDSETPRQIEYGYGDGPQ